MKRKNANLQTCIYAVLHTAPLSESALSHVKISIFFFVFFLCDNKNKNINIQLRSIRNSAHLPIQPLHLCDHHSISDKCSFPISHTKTPRYGERYPAGFTKFLGFCRWQFFILKNTELTHRNCPFQHRDKIYTPTFPLRKSFWISAKKEKFRRHQ